MTQQYQKLYLEHLFNSSDNLKRLLLRCVMHPLFLRSVEGKRFVVYLFGLHPPYIDDIHMTIKAQLPTCSKALLESYGEIYFKAWKVATGPYLLKIGIIFASFALIKLMPSLSRVYLPTGYDVQCNVRGKFHCCFCLTESFGLYTLPKKAKRSKAKHSLFPDLGSPVLFRNLLIFISIPCSLD